MNYVGMPMGMWALFAKLFQTQLTAVLGYDADTAKEITKNAKSKYKSIIAGRRSLRRATASRRTSSTAPCWGRSSSRCRSAWTWTASPTTTPKP